VRRHLPQHDLAVFFPAPQASRANEFRAFRAEEQTTAPEFSKQAHAMQADT
jgi:hypothetical protein